MMTSIRARWWRFVVLAAVLSSGWRALAADQLSWDVKQNRVTADITSKDLASVLGRVSAATGWRVYLEPGTTQRVSTKFRNLPPGEALQLLLAGLNHVLVPEGNRAAKLYVFRTAMDEATTLVAAERGKIIPNELVVRLKPGVNAEELAASLGARIKGKIPGINAFRLEFESDEAASFAREKLSSNQDVVAVENNYELDRRPDVQSGTQPGSALSLKLKPPPASGRVVVGLIDTAIQNPGGDLAKFIQPSVYVAGQPQVDSSTPSHGTAMLETLFNSLQNAAQGGTSVQVLPVDVYGLKSTTSTFDVSMGIIEAVNRGATVINLSLGSEGDSAVLHDVIAAAARRNITILAAAGNEPTTLPFYPAAYPEVMSVTALEQGQIAPYANRGDFVLLGAPGTSLIYFNNRAWYTVGTSAASAYTAGLAAAFLENSGNNPQALQNYLRQNYGLKTAGVGH